MRKSRACPPIRWEPELLARVIADTFDRMEREGAGSPRSRYKAAAGPLYELGPQERAHAFYELDVATALKLDLDGPLIAELTRAGWPREQVSEVVLSPAASDREAGADLEPRTAGPRVVFRVRPSRVGAGSEWTQFLAHELEHIADLLDPAFGYDGDRSLRSRVSSEVSVRDRYHALWCASVDVRLRSERRMPEQVVERRLASVVGNFRLQAGDEAIVRRWLGRSRPDHLALFTAAERPSEIGDLCPGVSAGDVSNRRTVCPICQFPAFPECVDASNLPVAVQDAVRTDEPSWSPEQGLCGRCNEIYLSNHEALVSGGTPCA